MPKKDRQETGQKKKDKKTNNDLQNTTQKTKDRVTRTPLKTRYKLRCSGKVSSSCSTCGTHHVILEQWKCGWLLQRKKACISEIDINKQTTMVRMSLLSQRKTFIQDVDEAISLTEIKRIATIPIDDVIVSLPLSSKFIQV